jgi:hypothetical protein
MLVTPKKQRLQAVKHVGCTVAHCKVSSHNGQKSLGSFSREAASGNGDRTAQHRMYTLGFSITWTVLAALFAWFIRFEPDWQQQEAFVKITLTAMPLAGLLFIRDSLRKMRRQRSVRWETTGEATVFIWKKLDGSEKRSCVDPRVEWDKDDRNFADP